MPNYPLKLTFKVGYVYIFYSDICLIIFFLLWFCYFNVYKFKEKGGGHTLVIFDPLYVVQVDLYFSMLVYPWCKD